MRVFPKYCGSCGSVHKISLSLQPRKLSHEHSVLSEVFTCTSCNNVQDTIYLRHKYEEIGVIYNGRYKTLDINSGKLFVVGDIRGDLAGLYTSLAKVNFNFETDTLITTGNLISHDIDGMDVIELLNKPWFHSVIGSYEDILVRAKGKSDLFPWFGDLDKATRKETINRFSALPYVIKVNYNGTSVAIAHASIGIMKWSQLGDVLTDVIKSKEILHNESIFDERKADYIEDINLVFLGHGVVKRPRYINNNMYIAMDNIEVLEVSRCL